jgi:hypothetical protein
MILPEYISLRDWADSLITDFPNDNIPILYNEEEWKEWGNDVIYETHFENLNAPSTDLYDNWKDWAYALYQTNGINQG